MNINISDYMERPGSLTLRSDHVTNYSRAILNSNWHQAREAEPKDYDLNKHPVRSLMTSTYKRMANVTDGSLPESTYQEHSKHIFLAPMFTEIDVHKPMITNDTLKHADIDRDTGDPKTGFGSVLPRHDPDKFKFYDESTYVADYKSHFDYVPAKEEKTEETLDISPAYRKCHSQFTDTTDYRRQGRNTWQDESGIYTNTHFKREIYKPTNTIPDWLV